MFAELFRNLDVILNVWNRTAVGNHDDFWDQLVA
eukprot:IDg4708t1